MSQTLQNIAEELRSNTEVPNNLPRSSQPLQKKQKKVQLIYALNGSGKTRLSRAFKDLTDTRSSGDGDNSANPKILYYNAFTEDLFTWENDHDEYVNNELNIRSNGLTEWLLPLLEEQGIDGNITTYFQEHTNTKITPEFYDNYTKVKFDLTLGGDDNVYNLKVSKGEESNFIWSIFYSMLDLAVSVLSETEVSNRETSDFNDLEYVFIDDPVSSLDENHLIHTAVALAKLVKKGSANLKFIISTHNPLFFNVLSNEFGSDRWDRDENGTRYWKRERFQKFQMERQEDGSLNFQEQSTDSPFSYHIHIKKVIKKAIDEGQIERYHFNLMRNLLEKTATFLGHNRWEMLLPQNADGQPDEQCMRALNIHSHSQHSGDEVAVVTENQVTKLSETYNNLVQRYHFKPETAQPNS